MTRSSSVTTTILSTNRHPAAGGEVILSRLPGGIRGIHPLPHESLFRETAPQGYGTGLKGSAAFAIQVTNPFHG